MRKMIFLSWLVVFLPALLFAQEKVEAPVWNTGDKWVFDRGGPMEVVSCDAQCFSVKFSGGMFARDASGVAVFDRSTLNVKYMLEKDRRKAYSGFRKKILNFPLTPGKQWTDLYQRDEEAATDMVARIAAEYRETFRILGWDEIEVRAGKFKAIKLEYKIDPSVRTGFGWIPQRESKAWYWYSPEVKNFVKCQYAKGYSEAIREEKGIRGNWELISYDLKK
jgi:hypothetical protein